jgi:hypothetical protein
LQQNNPTIIKQIGQPISSATTVILNNPNQNAMHASVPGSSVKNIINLNQQNQLQQHTNQQIITNQQTNLMNNNNNQQQQQQIQHQQLKLQLQSQLQQQQIRPALGQQQFQQK